jgi:alcohol dehydrogenase (cytochrome c)
VPRSDKGRRSACALLLLTILLLPQILPPLSVAAQSAAPGNWPGNDGNYPLNWNYSPQQAINAGNVNSLQAAWTFPVPAAISNYTGAEGVMVTPLVVGGIVYLVANWHRLFALDASTGGVIWYRDLPLLKNYTMYIQPSIPGPNGIPLGHYHQMIYTTQILGKPLIWVISNTYQVFALDANNGDVVIQFSPIARDWTSLEGNHGLYDVDTPTIVIDQKRGILLFGPSVSEGQSSGRGFLDAWDVNSTDPSFLWRDYFIPPQDGSDPGWSLSSVQNMSHASVFDGTGAVDLKALPQATLQKDLFGDWGNFGYDGKRSYAGAGAGWGGSWAIDESTGMAYVSTSTATPDWNATQRPGLDLWSDSVLAVNLTTGQMVWGFQAIPHPLGDFDCSWNVVLANETIAGKLTPVVFKGCKNGYIFALDADTGSMVWFLKPQAIRWDNIVPLNPLNSTQMTKYNWNGYPKTGRVVQNPPDTGALESDLAFDPTNGMVFAAVYNSPKVFQYTDVGSGRGPFNLTDWEFNWGVNVYSITQESPVNMTVMAIGGDSGQVKWSYFIPNLPYRGGLTVSGGVVYVSTLDGMLRFLGEADGSLLGQKLVGGELIDQPAIAQDESGHEMLFLTDLGSSRWGPVFPGFVQALSTTQASSPGSSQWLLPLALLVAASLAFVAGIAVAPRIRKKGLS